jgi:hypothetical protein
MNRPPQFVLCGPLHCYPEKCCFFDKIFGVPVLQAAQPDEI